MFSAAIKCFSLNFVCLLFLFLQITILLLICFSVLSFSYLLSFLYLIVLSLPQSTKFYYFFSHVYVSCLFFLFHFPKIFIIFLKKQFWRSISPFSSCPTFFLLHFPFPPFASPNSPQTSLAIPFFPKLSRSVNSRFVPHLATFSPVDI
jgi:hypothetical protein